MLLELPRWLSGKEFTCQYRVHRFNPWSRKISQVAEQLNLCVTTIEPVTPEPRSCNYLTVLPSPHVARRVKHLPPMWDTRVQSLGREDPLEKAMAPHSSILAWKIPWTEEPGRLQSMGSLRVGHDWATSLSLFTFMHWRRKWQPTPEFLPGESQGWGSLVGCSPWGHTESDTTKAT